jgi:hypothetical protein
VKEIHMNSIEINGWSKDPSLRTIITATFPQYRHRKIYIRAVLSVTLSDLNWSGGSRSEFRVCTFAGMPTGNSARFNAMAPWDQRQIEGQSLPTVVGHVIVKGGFFCGKESILTLFVHPSDMPRLLPRA